MAGAEPQVITDGRAEVDAGRLIPIGAGRLVAEDVLPVIDFEGSDVLPLRVADAAFVMDGDPAALADRETVSTVGFPEPGNHFGSLLAVHTTAGNIVVGQSNVKGVEAGREAYLAGRMPRKYYSADPSSPTEGVIGS